MNDMIKILFTERKYTWVNAVCPENKKTYQSADRWIFVVREQPVMQETVMIPICVAHSLSLL